MTTTQKKLLSRVKLLQATAIMLVNEANHIVRELEGVHPSDIKEDDFTDAEKAEKMAKMYKRLKIPLNINHDEK